MTYWKASDGQKRIEQQKCRPQSVYSSPATDSNMIFKQDRRGRHLSWPHAAFDTTTTITISRVARIPDPIRIERFRRAPELGPSVLFFTGGTALRLLSRVIKLYTHNSVHLVTPFDSGGSSAKLRDAFNIPAVGDLRNRIVALADESVRGNPEIATLFAYRLPQNDGVDESDDDSSNNLRKELDDLVSGHHPLVSAVPVPLRDIVRTHLRLFRDAMPSDFDLSGANLGNLMIAGGYLSYPSEERDLESVLFLFTKLLEVRGVVRPTVQSNLHLKATLEDGTVLHGQHHLTQGGKGGGSPISSPVKDLRLMCRSSTSNNPSVCEIGEDLCSDIMQADLIVYPMGSFYTSVIANLLPRGVGRILLESPAGCPRVYVPNTGVDPEQFGMTLSDCVRTITHYALRDVDEEMKETMTPSDADVCKVVNIVLMDVDDGNYPGIILDVDVVENIGVRVLRLDLADIDAVQCLHPRKLTEALLSFC